MRELFSSQPEAGEPKVLFVPNLDIAASVLI